MDDNLEPISIMRHGHVDDNGIRRLFVFGGRNNFTSRMKKNPNSINFVQEIFNVPSYYVFYIKVNNQKKYIHIEKNLNITITDIPTFFCDKELHDGELNHVAWEKMYEDLYKETLYFSQFGMYEKELIDANELKKQIFSQKISAKDDYDANKNSNNKKKSNNRTGIFLFIIILIITIILITIHNSYLTVIHPTTTEVKNLITSSEQQTVSESATENDLLELIQGNWKNITVNETPFNYKGKQCIYGYTYGLMFNEGKFMLFKNEVYATEDKNGNPRVVEENNYFDCGIIVKENGHTYLQFLDVNIEEFSQNEELLKDAKPLEDFSLTDEVKLFFIQDNIIEIHINDKKIEFQKVEE